MACSCSRPHWSAEELLEKTDVLSALLMNHPAVTGVAVTGSVARMEEDAHDLDLVVFHDGSLPIGGFRQRDEIDDVENRWDIPSDEIGADLVRRLQAVREHVPVTYLFVNETTLWICADLQALGGQEIHSGFWRTVFCQIPLLLFPEHRGVGLQKFTDYLRSETVSAYRFIPLRHHCGSAGCDPIASWEEIEGWIKERKVKREREALLAGGLIGWEDDS